MKTAYIFIKEVMECLPYYDLAAAKAIIDANRERGFLEELLSLLVTDT